MTRGARKHQKSGYLANVRHQAIKEAMEKFDKMCEVEDQGEAGKYTGPGSGRKLQGGWTEI